MSLGDDHAAVGDDDPPVRNEDGSDRDAPAAAGDLAGLGDDRDRPADREAVDRAFAELVAGYHLTSDRPDPLRSAQAVEPAATATELEPGPVSEAQRPQPDWADQHPLFSSPAPAARERVEPEELFVPEPLMPLPRPGWPVLAAWIAMGYAVLAVLAIALGIRLPSWAGWLAVGGFVGGFGVLICRLPRHRPPDAGNGAVL